MGLDMYLIGRHYLSRYFNPDIQNKQQKIAELFPELQGLEGAEGDFDFVREVQGEMGYWRKANAVHQWFVQHVQDGEDNCTPYSVSREQLQELKKLCEKVLAFRHLAVECLPTTQGFFFGSTDYDDHYFQDLAHTVGIIDRCLALPEHWEFQYQSSW